MSMIRLLAAGVTDKKKLIACALGRVKLKKEGLNDLAAKIGKLLNFTGSASDAAHAVIRCNQLPA